MKLNRWIVTLAMLLFWTTARAAVTFFDDTFSDGDYTATKTFDSTPGGGATFGAAQVLTGGNLDAFRLMDLSNVVPPGGVVIAHLWMNAAYDPAIDGPVAGIRAGFDGRFVSGSSGTSQFGYHLFFEQAGNRYVVSNLVWFAVAHGPGNGLPGSWTNFAFPTVVPTQFIRSTGSGPLTPDLSAMGAPITFGFFTTTSASSIPVSITGGVDNVSFTVLGTNDADLAVSKVATPAPALLGGTLTYTVTVENRGVVDCTSVTVTDVLPSSVTFVSASPGCADFGGTVVCNLGSLASGSNAVLTVDVTPTATGNITNTVTVSADQTDIAPDDNTNTTVSVVVPSQPDLTAELDAVFGACVTGPKGLLCPVNAQLVLRNNGLVYGDAVAVLTNTCKTTSVPAKCKLKGVLTVNELDLTGLPPHTLAFYLSGNTVLDGGDFLMKEFKLTKFLSAFLKGKTVKVSLKLPKGADLTGQHILVVIDHDDEVMETDETNNTDASPPIPALP